MSHVNCSKKSCEVASSRFWKIAIPDDEVEISISTLQNAKVILDESARLSFVGQIPELILEHTPKDNKYLLKFKLKMIIPPPVRPSVDDFVDVLMKQKVIKEKEISKKRSKGVVIYESFQETPSKKQKVSMKGKKRRRRVERKKRCHGED